MRKSGIILIVTFMFVLVFGSFASADQELDLDKLSYQEIKQFSENELKQLTDQLLQLSEDERLVFINRIGYEQVADNPALALGIPFTDQQAQEADEKYEAVKKFADTSIYVPILRKQFGEQVQNSTTATALLPIGTPGYYSAADTGYNYASDVPLRTKALWGTSGRGWIDAISNYLIPGGPGSGEALGSVGKFVQITGAGTRSATATIKGNYSVVMQANAIFPDIPVGFGTKARIDAEIYEYIPSSGALNLIKRENVLNKNFTLLAIPNTYSGTISKNLTANLQAGKIYLIRLYGYTYAGVKYWEVFSNSTSNMWSGGYGGNGVDFTSLQIRWN